MCDHPPYDSWVEPPTPLISEPACEARALLLDLDGVIVLKSALQGRPALPPGRLASRTFGTNMSLVSRATLARQLAKGGISVPADRIVSAASAAAAYVRRRFGDEPVYVLVAPDALPEFEGLRLLSHERTRARAAAVVVGDAQTSRANVQSGFPLLRAGPASLCTDCRLMPVGS
jgi:ribonucleotide monophosphatase NagD (HAD superfamily)